ncbi:MAG TPA: hypothetical protein VG734_18635 [Lacunisphaera sp.]|nr:hypothetical protein [Lacunisphaera sp.]
MWIAPPAPCLLATASVSPALLGWILLLGAVAWSVRRDEAATNSAAGRFAWWALVAGVLVAFRWPLIALPHELYPDESQLIAGAMTLRHDPVFWRSVDGGTAGPLDYFVMLPAASFSGTGAYAATRLTAALLIWGMLAGAGETLALVANRRVARLAVLPALAFEAFTTSPEFIHYSTELLPGLMLALAVLAIVRQGIHAARGNLWAAALLLGAVPFAKLQAAPIAAVLGLALVVVEIRAGRSRHVALLAGVALLPTVFFLSLVTITGQAEQMFIPYFLQNTLYAQTGRLPLGVVIRQFAEQSATNGHHALWLAGNAAFFAGTLVFVRSGAAARRRHLLAAAGLLAVTAICILSPGRPYHHYLNFLTLPVTLLAGTSLALAWETRTSANARVALAAAFLACTVLPLALLRASPRADPFEYYNSVISARGPAHGELVARIRSFASPGEALGVWGWRSSLYVEASLYQATRLAHTESLHVAGPWQKFYLRRFYDDLVAAAPPVIVDATGPGNFRFENRATGLESFPLLFDWVKARYQLVGEWDGARLYVRRDRVKPNP